MKEQTVKAQFSQYTNTVCPITLEQPVNNPEYFVVISTGSDKQLRQFFCKKEALERWVYHQSLRINEFGPITFKSPHTNLLETIGKVNDLEQVFDSSH